MRMPWKQPKNDIIRPISLNIPISGVSRALKKQSVFFLNVLHTQDHGDHVLITASKFGNAGGLIMLGRSDGVL